MHGERTPVAMGVDGLYWISGTGLASAWLRVWGGVQTALLTTTTVQENKMQNVNEDVTSFTYNEAQYDHSQDNKVVVEDRIELLEHANTILESAEFETHDKVTAKLQTLQRQHNAARQRIMDKSMAYNSLEEGMQHFYSSLRAMDPGADVAAVVDGFESMCEKFHIPLTKTVEVRVTLDLEVDVPISTDVDDLEKVNIGFDPDFITFTTYGGSPDVDEFEISEYEVAKSTWSD
jgi:hypothetical protein